MKKENECYLQQGDTLYFKTTLPHVSELEAEKTDIVQHGEATGHAHRLHGNGFQLYTHKETKQRYLRLVEPTALRHEEHKEIMLPPGDYRIGIVKEYDHWEEEARNVVD